MMIHIIYPAGMTWQTIFYKVTVPACDCLGCNTPLSVSAEGVVYKFC